ncbi:MAG: aspartate/glutamate racemase family protein [Pseudomonadota bacterium]
MPSNDEAAIGILMLESRFPRVPGDIGNPGTWPFPVRFKVVANASPDRVVHQRAEGLLEDFIFAGQELIDEGVSAITTSCGFLSLFQQELASSLSVPVMTSSLMQVELINRMMPNGKIAGILTIAASSLSKDHLLHARVPEGTPIGTTEGGREFTRVILNDETSLDIELARQDNIEAAVKFKSDHPELGAIVLECTNMTPYAKDIARETGLPVFNIETLVTWIHSGLSPREFNVTG